MNRRIIIVCLVIILLLNIRLWNENLWYRLYIHRLKDTYDIRKIPFLKKCGTLPPDLYQSALHVSNKCCALKPSPLTQKYKAFHANNKGGAIYWHQLKEFYTLDKNLEVMINNLQNFAKECAENATGKKLYAFKFSMWNVFVLKYTGTQGSFGWHYDHETPEDYRVLFCINRTPTCGRVEYMDEDKKTQSLDLASGEGYILRGSTTFHRVTNNESEDDERLMLGFHFSTKPNKVTKNLCYFSTLTHWQLGPALSILWNQNRY